MMRHIEICTIPHEHQRYSTTGDYFRDRDGVHQIRVSYVPDWRMNFLVMVHELIEYGLALARGIPEEEVTAFDIQFEKEREQGLHSEHDEPGDDKTNPYYREHFFATSIERIVAQELGVDWQDYGQEISKLYGD